MRVQGQRLRADLQHERLVLQASQGDEHDEASGRGGGSEATGRGGGSEATGRA